MSIVTPIPWDELDVRASQVLKKAGCKTVEDIIELGYTKLLQEPNCGRKTLELIGMVTGVWAPDYRGPSTEEQLSSFAQLSRAQRTIAQLRIELAEKQRIIDAFNAGYAKGRKDGLGDDPLIFTGPALPWRNVG